MRGRLSSFVIVLTALALAACGGGGLAPGGAPSGGSGANTGGLALRVDFSQLKSDGLLFQGELQTLVVAVKDPETLEDVVFPTRILRDPLVNSQTVVVSNITPGRRLVELMALDENDAQLGQAQQEVMIRAGATTTVTFGQLDLVDPNPVTNDDQYSTMLNTQLTVTAADGVLSNDTLAGGTITANSPTAQGATLTLNADGSLTYDPPTAFVGADTFTYTVTNETGSDQATVTVHVINRVFFVDNSAASGGDGSLQNPFDNLVDAQLAANQVGDLLFFFRGNGSSYGTPSALLNNQFLFGEAVGLNVNSVQVVDPNPGVFPVFGGPIDLADGNELKGLEVNGGTTAVSGNGVAGTVLADCRILNTSGDGINLTNCSGTLSLTGYGYRQLLWRRARGQHGLPHPGGFRTPPYRIPPNRAFASTRSEAPPRSVVSPFPVRVPRE